MEESSSHVFQKEILCRKDTVGKRQVIPVALFFGLGAYVEYILFGLVHFVDPHHRLESGTLTQHRPGRDSSFKRERQTRADSGTRDMGREPQSGN